MPFKVSFDFILKTPGTLMPLWSENKENLGFGNDPLTIFLSDKEPESLIEVEESKPKPNVNKVESHHFLENKVYECEIEITEYKVVVKINEK